MVSTIAVFGATGRTGRRVVERALSHGLAVRVLARDPAKIVLADDRLTVIEGDVLDASSVDKTVAGAEAVVSVIGHVKGSPATLQADGTTFIVNAMQRHGVSRIITLSGGGLRAEGKDKPKMADRMIRGLLKVLSGRVLADAEAHVDVLKRSGLEWTVVRGPRLTEEPGTGSYRVGWVGGDSTTKLSRDDLADFILTQIDDRQYVWDMPFVSGR
ncbi:NAD(P)-dependent oxidoreductase [Flaviflexus huanghaiensis]|uniref:NAD(P)-dependent oxidoreductase n=1 Tax=Flaviflexus huanghaiensis TaxID=1111473 RepID=UPI0015FDECA9|nr:NAD(P)H-binding protein [Flaviflexus huanghaiensis]